LHYTQGAWQPVPSPTKADLLTVSIVSPDEGWAAGMGYGPPLIHYKDGAWQLPPGEFDFPFTSLSMTASNQCWAVGYGSLILQYP
jgi:hypothetical protein